MRQTSISNTYSLEELKCLQHHVQRNADVWTGLRDFYFEMSPKTWNQTLFSLWGPMAEQIHAGKDLVKENFGHVAPA